MTFLNEEKKKSTLQIYTASTLDSGLLPGADIMLAVQLVQVSYASITISSSQICTFFKFSFRFLK